MNMKSCARCVSCRWSKAWATSEFGAVSYTHLDVYKRQSYTHPTMIAQLGPRRFAAEGSPADCVLAGIHDVLEGAKPDLVLSGVNRGCLLYTSRCV